MTESRDEAAVRAMLQRRAADVHPSPGAWEAIADRLGEPVDATVVPFRRATGRTRLLAVAAAAAVVAAGVGGLTLLDRSEPTSSIVADDGEVDAPAPGVAGSQAPIWPATTSDELAELQAAADAGQRDDLLDPVGVAGGYLTERLAGPGEDLDDSLVLELGDFEPGGDEGGSGSVTYLLDGPGGRHEGFVDVRRLGGEGSIWVVTRAGTPSIDVTSAAYDGTDVSGSFRSVPGFVEVEIRAVDGSDPIVTLPFEATPTDDEITFTERFADESGVTLLVRFFESGTGMTGAIAEVRLDVDAAPAAAGTPIPAVWPEVTEEALLARPDATTTLADPMTTVGAYLGERLPPGTEWGLDDFQRGDAQSGSVRYDTVDGLVGEVQLRRLGGEGTPWYVVATGNDLVVLLPEDVDGDARLSVTAEAAGTVVHEVRAVDGEVLATGQVPTGPRETTVLATLDHDGALVTTARLIDGDGRVVSFLEVWTDPAALEGTEADAATTTTTTPVEGGAATGETTVVLEAEGLGFLGAGDDTSIARLAFGSDQGDVIAALTSSVGAPVEIGTNQDCPPGPAEVAQFADGFVATFQDGALVGWAVQAPSTIATAASIGVGSTVADVQAAYAGITVEETSLGWELMGGDLYGIVSGPSDDAVVENLFGGSNCIFR